MKIWTSYFGNERKIPADLVRISICGKPPPYYNGYQFRKLAPKYWFFDKWKQDHDDIFYTVSFCDEVLGKLDPISVVEELSFLSQGRDVVLLCYEKPDQFCHRHIVADWFGLHGIKVKELSNVPE